MLEGVLDQRDEYHGSHGQVVALDIGSIADVDRLRQPDTHQLDVVADESHFLFQRHDGLLGVVECMAQHLRQLLNGLLCLGSVEGRQCIDIVERVQQEMWINLTAQIAQLGVRTRSLGFTACLLVVLPAHGQHYGCGHSGKDGKVEDVAYDEKHDVDSLWRIGRPVHRLEQLMGVNNPIVVEESHTDDHHGVDEQEVAVLPLHEEARRQPQVVGVEHHHEQQRLHAVHQILPHRHARVPHERQGREKHVGPEGHMQKQSKALIHCYYKLR